MSLPPLSCRMLACVRPYLLQFRFCLSVDARVSPEELLESAAKMNSCNFSPDEVLHGPAELWLQDEISEDQLRERRKAIPEARPLDFQLTLTRDFIRKYPFKEGGEPSRSTIKKFAKLPSETSI